VSGIRLWAEATGRLMTGMALVSPHELLTYKVNSLDQCIMPVDHRSSYFDQRTRVRVQ
jgi:V8-like Glu-specific endopeptidase